MRIGHPTVVVTFFKLDSNAVGPDGKGTTDLHVDMTDAVNVMTWAGTPPSKRPGCAVWDIFPSIHAAVIRQYLLDTATPTMKDCVDGAIQRQRNYLTSTDLQILREKHHVVPWRIYQNPGDAVFIPAGCPHQVCNLTACITVACGFVSPENVARCAIITGEARSLAMMRKREDVLQLKNLLYFAWKGLYSRLIGT